MARARRLTLTALLVLSLAAAGCDEDDLIITDPDGDIAFDTVLLAQRSELEESLRLVIDSQDEWEEMWDEIGRGGPAPEIDFRRDELLLVSAGTRPNSCYSIQIRQVTLRAGSLEVDADEIAPGPGCLCLEETVRPVHVVRIRETNRRPDFDVRQNVRDCG